VREGEILAVWGGDVLDGRGVEALRTELRRLVLQIDEDLYVFSRKEGPADWINHSCEPNAGLSGQVTLVALRDIACGEEITYDYAMSDGSGYDEFACGCSAARCRGRVSGHDWARPDLWERYSGHFSTYLQRRIDAIRARRSVSCVELRSSAMSTVNGGDGDADLDLRLSEQCAADAPRLTPTRLPSDLEDLRVSGEASSAPAAAGIV
jgi:hypothetical protein